MSGEKSTIMSTAVNYLMSEFCETGYISFAMFEKAKEMEKQQICSAFDAGVSAMEEFNECVPEEDEQIELQTGNDYYSEVYIQPV